MKILLLTSPSGRKEIPVFPLGLSYIAAMLKDHAVTAEDLNCADKPLDKLSQVITREAPDVICVSLRYIDTCSSYDKFYYYPAFIECVKQIKKIKKNVTLIAGGAGFTLFAGQIMKDAGELDFGVLFEGEETIVELLANLDRPYSVKGICYRSGGEVCFTEKRDALNFDDLPLPERRFFRMDAYKVFPEQMGVQTKRGCVFKCIYCSYPYLSGSSISLRSPWKVGEDIERLAAEGVKRIFFTDCIFNYPKEHALQICHEIIKRKLKVRWKAFFNEKFMDTEILSAAEEAGCELFIFGPDGASGKTLKSLKKNFNYEEMIKAYDLFRAPSGAGFKCAFMFNVPGETVKTALNLAKLILRMFFTKKIGFTIGNMRIYPGTELRRAAIKKRVIKESTNLIKPVYYDPFPLKPVSCLLNHMENIIYTVKRLSQSDRIG